MNFWQRIVGHSNFFKDSDWNYFFEVSSLSTILIAQTLGQLISSGDNDMKVLQDVSREERKFLRSKLFQNGLEESSSEHGSLSKKFELVKISVPWFTWTAEPGSLMAVLIAFSWKKMFCHLIKEIWKIGIKRHHFGLCFVNEKLRGDMTN